MKKKILLIAVLVIAGGSAAVAALGGLTWLDSMGLRGDEALVRARLNAYWDARMEGDLEKIALYVHPLQDTLPNPGMLVTERADITSLVVEGDKAVAMVDLAVRLRHPVIGDKKRELTVDDHWVRFQGKWYKDISPVGFSQTIKNLQGRWDKPTDALPVPAEQESEQNQ